MKLQIKQLGRLVVTLHAELQCSLSLNTIIFFSSCFALHLILKLKADTDPREPMRFDSEYDMVATSGQSVFIACICCIWWMLSTGCLLFICLFNFPHLCCTIYSATKGRHNTISLQLVRKVNVSEITILRNVEDEGIFIRFANWKIFVVDIIFTSIQLQLVLINISYSSSEISTLFKNWQRLICMKNLIRISH